MNDLKSLISHKYAFSSLCTTVVLSRIAPAIEFWKYQQGIRLQYLGHILNEKEKMTGEGNTKLQQELAETQAQLQSHKYRLAALEQELNKATQACQMLERDYSEASRYVVNTHSTLLD